jgi:hypothetical protein
MALSRDLKTLKENGAASAAEMAEFLAHLRGRRPQEVLGIVAGNGLTRGVVIASVWTLVLMALFTAGPYLWPKIFPPEKQAVAQDAPPAAAKPAAKPAEQSVAPEVPPAAAPATPAVPTKDVLDKLGIGEAKQADPKTNPLENKVDDLLKDLK